MIESCSKIDAGDWNEARKATWRLRMRVASRTKRLGKPSLNFLFRVEGVRSQEKEMSLKEEAPGVERGTKRKRKGSGGPELTHAQLISPSSTPLPEACTILCASSSVS